MWKRLKMNKNKGLLFIEITVVLVVLMLASLWVTRLVLLCDVDSAKTAVTSVTLVDLIPGIKAGVVHISTPAWQGSGFVIGEHLIATARHVVEGVEDFEIILDDGSMVSATKAISSKNYDVAFIWIEDSLPVPLKLGSIAECQLGQRIITIGSAYGKVNINSVTLGIISGLDRDYSELNSAGYYGEQDYGWSVAFQTDSPGHPGNSGCPVFTSDGVVRGILVGGFSPSLIICMPVDLFIDDIDEINRMFIQGKYYCEEITDVAEEVWDY